DVAYDAAGNRYLVVWSGEKSVDGKFEVYGRFLNGDTGVAVGQDDFRITHTGSDQNTAFGAFRPKVQALSANGQFFLVWYADTVHDGAFDVFGQRLAAGSRIMAARVNTLSGGLLPPGEFPIRTVSDENPPPFSDAPPSVSFNALEDEYLVVWTSAEGGILGRRVDAATGALQGYGSIPMNSGSGGSFPAVAHAAAEGEFLVVWQQDKGGGETEIYGQRIDGARGLRSGELELQLSRVGPDGDPRFAARWPSIVPNAPNDRFLLMWAGNARPAGANHLTATFRSARESQDAGNLNWVMSARETALGVNGPVFSGAVTSSGEDGVVVVGGFGALTRIDSDGAVSWSVPPGKFVSTPVDHPLTAEDGTLLVPGKPGQGETVGYLNAVAEAGTRIWEQGAGTGAWLPCAEGPDAVVYAPSPSGLTAFDSDGQVLWEFPTGDFTPVAAPAVDPAGRLFLGTRDSMSGDRSRLYALSLAGTMVWTLDVDWPIGDDYAIALGPDGTVYLGGTSLGAVSPDGALRWEVHVGGVEGGSCRPAVGDKGQVICAAGNSVEAFGPSGERIWSFQADEEEEIYSPYVAMDGGGTIYAVATGSSSMGQEGRLYALDGFGKLRWKAILAGESFQRAVPSFDHLGNLYLVSDEGSLLSVRTGDPAVEGGWSAAGGDERHSGQRNTTETQRLNFAQFAGGSIALSSRLILLNPSREREITAHVRLRDDQGRPMVIDVNGSNVAGEVSVPVPAQGLRTLLTGSAGELQVGSALVESDQDLAGLILFRGSVGLAGVGASAEQLSSFLVPIESNPGGGLNTGVAMMNLEDSDLDVALELLDRDGRTAGKSVLAGAERLAGGGQMALYVDGFAWDRPVDFTNFAGLLKVTASGRLSATAIQTRPRQFATMPVTARSDRQWGKLLDRSLQAQAGPSGPYRLQFAQFADGTEGGSSLFSEILLFNPDQSSPVQASLRLRDDSGAPIRVDLNDQMVDGAVDVALPPLGLRVFETDGLGELVTGSVTVESDGPLSGVIIFGGVTGLAGVGSSRELGDGFVAPVETDAEWGVDTGIAVVNLENRQTNLDLSLVDPEGGTIAHASLDGSQALPSMGHRALFVDQVQWDTRVDLTRFEGSLRIRSDGTIAVTVLQTRPGQLATMPVVPIPPHHERPENR
ncbi:MAG: PQQ-binding-like beta-propeller repeat protein, partial [Acidobacteriota bacterium]